MIEFGGVASGEDVFVKHGGGVVGEVDAFVVGAEGVEVEVVW